MQGDGQRQRSAQAPILTQPAALEDGHLFRHTILDAPPAKASHGRCSIATLFSFLFTAPGIVESRSSECSYSQPLWVAPLFPVCPSESRSAAAMRVTSYIYRFPMHQPFR